MKVRLGLNVAVRIVLCVLILALGFGAFVGLRSMAKPPAQADIRERPIRVNTITAKAEDIQVFIEGFGVVRPRDVVDITPEVAGRVVEVHPDLEEGVVIPKGDLLFRIDPRDYSAQLAEAEARIAQLKNTVDRLSKQYALDLERLETVRRNESLAKADFERAKELFERDVISTQSEVDNAEIAYNQAQDATDQLEQQVNLMPLRIEEAKAELSSAEATRDRAKADLDRTVVRAPFEARIDTVNLESDQYVAPGDDVLTLADDSLLEITVPLNSSDARKWLQFEDARELGENARFGGLKRVKCPIRWTDDPKTSNWTGTLHRVERFDENTRQLTVVIRVEGSEVLAKTGARLPLLAGMFCRVQIPGRVAEDVFRVPSEAVSYDLEAQGQRTVFVALRNEETNEYRLATRPVAVVHEQGGDSFISEGLTEGALVITTRLVNPLENTLLDVEARPKSEDPS